MGKRKKPDPPNIPLPTPPTASELGLEAFEAPPDDLGLSLDELSQTYAALMGGGEDPYKPAPPQADAVSDDLPATLEDQDADEEEDEKPAPGVDFCEITPRSILEAMLFVGHPTNESLASQNVASLMRGVTAAEIDELVRDLNETYLAENAPYVIESAGVGYRLVLRAEAAGVRDKFHGRVKEAKLSQANIDVLAIIAYNQPLTRPEIDKLRGRPSGAVISQLVRRELLRIERPVDEPRTLHYYTTDRFLELFGLQCLDDLPRTNDADRGL